jgi:hypothetical protein
MLSQSEKTPVYGYESFCISELISLLQRSDTSKTGLLIIKFNALLSFWHGDGKINTVCCLQN